MEHEYGLSIGHPVLGPRHLATVREFEQPGLTHRRILSDPGARSGSYGALLTDPWVALEAIRERTPPDS